VIKDQIAGGIQMSGLGKKLAAGVFLIAVAVGMQVSAQQPAPKLYNHAKQKLLEGKTIFSYTVSRPDPELYCEVAKHYDFVWFEMQHSTMTWADIEKMIAACPRPAATPMVRIQDELESSLQHATDIGVLGIVMPTVDTVEKAEAAVKYSHYPPFGRRSQGAGQAAAIWGVDGINYRQTVNDNMLTIVMIETPVGVANVAKIAALKGVDGVMVANTDLGNFSGWAHDDERYQQMVTKIHDATLKAGKWLGATDSTYREGRPDSKDFHFFQNGPPNDGYQPPAGRGGKKKQ
jgi:2-keto-3-deoxy-L-rhamnonate aldolase RhmA